ncbi:MAG: DUF5652 family protein [Nanoarchaeota archaeon]
MKYFDEGIYLENFINSVSHNFGLSSTVIIVILVAILLWSTVWKLLGLWKSARKGSIIWFIIIALTNTIGILPILYIYVFSKIDWNKFTKVKQKKKAKKKKAKRKKR